MSFNIFCRANNNTYLVINRYTHVFMRINIDVPKTIIDEAKKLSRLLSTSRQRSGKGAIRKRLPLQKPRWEKTKLTIRYLYHENTS